MYGRKIMKGWVQVSKFPRAPPSDLKTTFAELDPGTFLLKGKERQEKETFLPFYLFCLLSSFPFFLSSFPFLYKKTKGNEKDERRKKRRKGPVPFISFPSISFPFRSVPFLSFPFLVRREGLGRRRKKRK